MNLDRTLVAVHHWIRSQPLLYRLTLGTRILLACGFIPTGLIKLLGMRFTLMDPATPVGALFETLYQVGPFWRFIGLSQIVAGLLILIPRTATLGALIFTPIIANIFVLTVAVGFQGTPVVTGLMLLATLWLLAWDYDRLRVLVSRGHETESAGETGVVGRIPYRVPDLTRVERVVYAVGGAAGFVFFLSVRGLTRWLPFKPGFTPLLVAAVCALAAVVLGVANARGPRRVQA
jgi:hypothetical protein